MGVVSFGFLCLREYSVELSEQCCYESVVQMSKSEVYPVMDFIDDSTGKSFQAKVPCYVEVMRGEKWVRIKKPVRLGIIKGRNLVKVDL